MGKRGRKPKVRPPIEGVAKGALFYDESTARLRAEQGDAAFVAALSRAIARGRERARSGTFVDPTAPLRHHRRLIGDTPASLCGSPAAMCAE